MRVQYMLQDFNGLGVHLQGMKQIMSMRPARDRSGVLYRFVEGSVRMRVHFFIALVPALALRDANQGAQFRRDLIQRTKKPSGTSRSSLTKASVVDISRPSFLTRSLSGHIQDP